MERTKKVKGKINKKQLVDINSRCGELLIEFRRKDYNYGMDLFKIVKEYVELKKRTDPYYDNVKIANEFGRNKLWLDRILILEETTKETKRLMEELKLSPVLVSFVLYGIRNRCPEKQDEIIRLIVKDNLDITKLHYLITTKYLTYNSGGGKENEKYTFKINYIDSFYNSINNAKDIIEKINLDGMDETKLGIVKSTCKEFIEQVNKKFFKTHILDDIGKRKKERKGEKITKEEMDREKAYLKSIDDMSNLQGEGNTTNEDDVPNGFGGDDD